MTCSDLRIVAEEPCLLPLHKIIVGESTILLTSCPNKHDHIFVSRGCKTLAGNETIKTAAESEDWKTGPAHFAAH
jgi:hypothetical protein